MTKERAIRNPLTYNWCSVPEPNCPYAGNHRYSCGIRQRLDSLPTEKARRGEAERLYQLAEKDPRTFYRLCANELWGEYPTIDSERQ